MRKPWTLAVLLACTFSLLVACKARDEAAPSAREEAPPPVASTAETTPPPQATVEPAPAVVSAAPTTESTTPVPQPGVPLRTPAPASPKPVQADPKAPPAGPAPKATEAVAPTAPPPISAPTAAPAPQAAAKPSGSEIIDPGGDVAVSPTKAGLTRIGAEKCKLCHKVQHASWATSAHARRTPPLDCESCHGPGSEYKTLTVMKDPVKAKAAGLVQPDGAFCGKCHKGKWDPALLGKVHAHKSAS